MTLRPEWIIPPEDPRYAEDARWMREALALARSRRGATWPNPTVGAVVVRDGRIAGRGFHPKAGAEHAEVMALKEAGAAAAGSTLYVTLEPCNHHGRTPPCTEAIIQAGVARVVAAVPDPNVRVGGNGFQRLAAAGITVAVGVEAAEAVRLNEPFFSLVARKRPWVTWKSATSLDGKTATATGHSRWITGPAARREVHRLRATLPAILVGVGTVLTDDPRLTARDGDGRPMAQQPLRVIADTEARTPPTAQLLAQPGSTLIASGEGCPPARVRALEAAGAEVAVLPRGADGRIRLPALMEALTEREVVGVLLEGGATLAGAMLAEGYIDEVVFHVAPLIIGGEGLDPVRGGGTGTVEDGWRLYETRWEPLGPDLQVRGTLQPLASRCREYFGPTAAIC